MENKKRKVKAAVGPSERNVSRSASNDNVLANEFMAVRQRFNLANVDEADSECEGGEGGGRRYDRARRGKDYAKQNGGGGQFFLYCQLILTVDSLFFFGH